MTEKFDFNIYSDNLLLIVKTEFLKEKSLNIPGLPKSSPGLAFPTIIRLIFSKPSNLLSFKVSEIDFPVSLAINEILTFSKYIRIPLI